MNDISGSVNVSEILATLDGVQKAAVMDRALVIIYKNRGDSTESAITFINHCREMTPVQQSAVKALLTEVKRRRQELLDELMKAVEDAMVKGTDFCQKIGRIGDA